MFRNLGTLTAVVLLSFLVSLGLSRGILAAVLKAMSYRRSSFMGSKARLVPLSRAKTPLESSLLNNAGRTAQRAMSGGDDAWQKTLTSNPVPQWKR